jgi:predicted component of type VI protein secretion system
VRARGYNARLARMSGFLVLMDGRRVPVNDGLLIGRQADCQIVLDDAKCSRRHARLVVAAGVVEIEDLQSSNGTLLNGKPVQRRMLRDGDEVQIGKTTLRFTAAPPAGTWPAAAATPPPAVEPRVELRETPPPTPPRSPAPRAAPEPGPPPPVDVIEFADETVELRAPRAEPGQPAGKPPARDARGILQFHKQPASRAGLLGDDLRQMSAAQRTVLVLLAVAVAAGLGWAVMRAVG